MQCHAIKNLRKYFVFSVVVTYRDYTACHNTVLCVPTCTLHYCYNNSYTVVIFNELLVMGRVHCSASAPNYVAASIIYTHFMWTGYISVRRVGGSGGILPRNCSYTNRGGKL